MQQYSTIDHRPAQNDISRVMRRYQCMMKPRPCADLVFASSPRPLLAAAAALVWLGLLVADGAKIGLPGCTTSCGETSVPYPFGIGPGCSLKGFNLTCEDTQWLYISGVLAISWNVTVREISLDDSTLLIYDDFSPRSAPSSKQLNDGQQSVAPPGGFFSKDEPRLYWMLISSALQERNKTRAGNATCPKDLGATACHSTHSTCQSITIDMGLRPPIIGYRCRCDDGYQGNAYLSDGCQDVDGCSFPNKCYGNCTNFPGSKYL